MCIYCLTHVHSVFVNFFIYNYVLRTSKQVTKFVSFISDGIIDENNPVGKIFWHFRFLLRQWGLKNILTQKKKEVKTN